MCAPSTKRTKLKAVTLLPEPDSPTKATFSPCSTLKVI
jgi:hypothetical protein